MTKRSEIFTGNGPRSETGQKPEKETISVHGSAIELPREDVPQMRDPAHPKQDRAVGEERNPQATRGSFPVIETDFAELEDGSLIEMIEDPRDPGNSLFAVCKNGTFTYEATVQCKNHIFAPLRRKDQIWKDMRFPQGVIRHESVTTLLARILGLILRCVDVEECNAILVSAFVLSACFVERLSVAPYLCIVGPPQSGKTTLLELLKQLCRHALLTADVTSAALYDVYDKLTPTLIVDETLTAPDRRALFHFLRAGSTRGSVILRKGRSVNPFGPKVISCTEMPNDTALDSRCIIIPMMESTRTDLWKLTDNWVIEATTGLRMALLDYRLRNFRSLCLPKIVGDECLYSRTRDLYQALALPVGSDENLCKFLIGRFKHQQEINREPLSPASATTLRSLDFFIHSHPDAAKCGNKDLMMTANLTPESLSLNAHEIGRALTSLGFTDRKRTNAGYILWLDWRTRKRIHQLAHEHGIDHEAWFIEGGFAANCPLCKELAEPNRGSADLKQDA